MVAVQNVAVVGVLRPTHYAVDFANALQATGTVGSYIVKELLASGKHTITALTRMESQAKMPPGVHAVKINYDDPETLVKALVGQEALIITMSPRAAQDTQSRLVEAAAVANVRYIIPNGWGFDPSHPSSDDSFLGPVQRAVQAQIEELGKSSWIEFVSGPWYELSLVGSPDRFGFDLQGRRVTLFDTGHVKINTSTWAQTGRAVARVLALDQESAGDGSQLDLTKLKDRLVFFSSFLVSQRDIFHSVLRVTGTKEEEWTVTEESSRQRYHDGVSRIQQGDRSGFLRAMYSRSFFVEENGFGSAAFEPTRGTFNQVLGLPVEDLDEMTRAAIEMSSKT